MYDDFFENRILIETRKEISFELEDDINKALKEVFKKHRNDFRHIVNLEKGEWLAKKADNNSK